MDFKRYASGVNDLYSACPVQALEVVASFQGEEQTQLLIALADQPCGVPIFLTYTNRQDAFEYATSNLKQVAHIVARLPTTGTAQAAHIRSSLKLLHRAFAARSPADYQELWRQVFGLDPDWTVPDADDMRALRRRVHDFIEYDTSPNRSYWAIFGMPLGLAFNNSPACYAGTKSDHRPRACAHMIATRHCIAEYGIHEASVLFEGSAANVMYGQILDVMRANLRRVIARITVA